ncbi:hypothetical protein ABT364_12525 [Massilia sp. SR12]
MNRTTRMPDKVTVFIASPDPKFPKQKALHAYALGAIRDINKKVDVHLTQANEEDAIIHVSFGTSFLNGTSDYQNYVANVTSIPGSGDEIKADGYGDISTKPVYIQIGHNMHGNEECDCWISQDTVVHEFGHALGLQRHFTGFSGEKAISYAFWDVLATLYHYSAGTDFEKIRAHRARISWIKRLWNRARAPRNPDNPDVLL